MPIAVGTHFAFREGNKTVAVGEMTAIHPDTEEDIQSDKLKALKAAGAPAPAKTGAKGAKAAKGDATPKAGAAPKADAAKGAASPKSGAAPKAAAPKAGAKK